MPLSIHHPRYQALRASLVALRKQAGLSQGSLGERLGVGQPFISKVERGESYVDVMLFIDWCHQCNIPSAGQVLDRFVECCHPRLEPRRLVDPVRPPPP